MLTLLCFSLSCATSSHKQEPPADTDAVLGYWQGIEGDDAVIVFDSERRTELRGGRVYRTGRILKSNGEQMWLCIYGQDVESEVRVRQDHLEIVDAETQGEVRRFRRLSQPPAGLSQLIELPRPQDLPSPRVESIQKEIRRRHREDIQAEQAAFGTEIGPGASQAPLDPLARLKMIDVTSRNREYLLNLMEEVGWIDGKRFGYATSNAAMLMVQHSGDRPLMEAVLPWIKRDVDAGYLDGSAYALVYDRLQLALGERQLYATQVGRDENDRPLIYPTEDPENVESRRKALGLRPLAEYIKLFGGTEVRFSSACSGSRN